MEYILLGIVCEGEGIVVKVFFVLGLSIEKI